MYGGMTLLSVLTQGAVGTTSGELVLNEVQWALWRAGHAHAGVWVILSLVMQILIDSTKLPRSMMWLARIGAPLGAVTVSAGFFGVAFVPVFKWVLYFGGLSLLAALLLTGIGLLKNLRSPEANTE